MNNSCDQIRQVYSDLFALVSVFKNLDLKTDKLTAMETKRKLEKHFSELSEFSCNSVYYRKKLAEDAGLLYIGQFDDAGLALAWESREFLRFVDRRGKLVMPKNVQAETPFKDGYAVITRNNTVSVIDHTLRKQKDFSVQFPPNQFTDMSAVCVRIKNKSGKVIEWRNRDFLGKLEFVDDAHGIRHFFETDKNGNAVIAF